MTIRSLTGGPLPARGSAAARRRRCEGNAVTPQTAERTSSGVPEATTWPSSIMMTRVARARTSSARCDDRTRVRPSAASPASSAITCRCPTRSRLAVGSSSTSSRGSPSSAAARDSRCRMPVEKARTERRACRRARRARAGRRHPPCRRPGAPRRSSARRARYRRKALHLRHVAELALHRPDPGDVDAAECPRATEANQPEQAAEQSGLAGAIRADQRDRLAAPTSRPTPSRRGGRPA